MSDNLSQLDELIESDVLEALGQEPVETQDVQEEMKEPVAIDDINLDEQDLQSEGNFAAEDPQDMLGTQAEAFFEAQLNEEDEIEASEEEIKEDNPLEPLEIQSSDIGSIAAMLEKLLKNKTIEITIKVKD